MSGEAAGRAAHADTPAPAAPSGAARSGLATHEPSLAAFVGYFLRLGAFGFGGPIALTGAMQRDLVVARGWISEEDYLQGLALAQLAPGPLAAQLAIYLGWVRAGIAGATLVAVAFVLPSLLMVIALSWGYVQLGGMGWIRGAFYGVAPAAVALIARGAVRLARLSLGRDPLRWAVFVVSAGVTAMTSRESPALVIASGFLVWAARSRPRRPMLAAVPWLGALTTGLHGVAAPATLLGILGYFATAGSLVFGSGLAIVPYLHGGVVLTHHWLTERQFLDAVAVAMITPGPVVITVAFIGYLVAGLAGALLAAVGVFLPCYLLVVLPAPLFRRHAGAGAIAHFVSGVTAAATGAIAGAVIVLGRQALVDVPAAGIALGATALPFVTKRIPDPVLIVLAGLAGWLIARGG